MEYPKSTQPLPKHAKKVFEGVLFNVWQWEQEMFDGSFKTFEKASREASVSIFPVTLDKKIILTVQEQPGIDKFISLVGGVVDHAEDIIDCAHRELLEEVGAKTSNMDFWYSVQPVTKVEWPIYMFVARNCEVVAPINLDSGEKISIKYVTWDEFLEIIKSEEFRDEEVALRLLRLQSDPAKFKEVKNFLLK